MKSPPDVYPIPMLTYLLQSRLTLDGWEFLTAAFDEIKSGVSFLRFKQLLSLASRHVASDVTLDPNCDELRRFEREKADFDPVRWSLLETLRIALLLSFAEVANGDFPALFDRCFRFADHNETCALYRALPLLPYGPLLVARARQGCRTNMRTVFEAVACDSNFPVRHFDDASWCQLILKAVFIDVPLARIESLDTRLSPELARMALDFADERRSAGRDVPAQLWLCLGPYAGARGLAALRAELQGGTERGKQGALLALGRAGALTHDEPAIDCAWQEHAAFVERAREAGFSARAIHLSSQLR
ncbi:EboA domain-containing protein [Trinickia sp. NRRL B-1857]|uniref:EboA domain-containing protein n=1 Tax=Trinickia sp. NRRL B-1857 TaxID=3162879 RepID=UPI003D2C038A